MYKEIDHYLYATKYRDFCLQGAQDSDEDIAMRFSEFNMLFYLGTKQQEDTVQKYINHLVQKVHMQLWVYKLHNELNEINEYESNSSAGS